MTGRFPIALMVAMATGHAVAQPAEPSPRAACPPGAPESECPPQDAHDSPIAADTKREVPDYDQREDQSTSAGEVILWVPRVLLFPVYLVSEYLIRKPVGWLVRAAEFELVPLVATLGSAHESHSGFAPTGRLDVGMRPRVGLYFYWDQFVLREAQLRARLAFGGLDWWKLDLVDRVSLSDAHEVWLGGGYETRDDWPYHGPGPRSAADGARFGMERARFELGQRIALLDNSALGGSVGVRAVSIDPSASCCSDPSLDQAVARGTLSRPVGSAEPFTVAHSGLSLDLDSRPPRFLKYSESASDFAPPPGTGVRLSLRAEHDATLARSRLLQSDEPERSAWLRYGATAGGYVDLTGHRRVLGLELSAELTEPLTGRIPFTEQVRLGGETHLRGFLPGRLLGPSAAIAKLSYTWPVWVWLDGQMHYSLGNVFGEDLAGFETEALRSSFGIGLLASKSRDHIFETLLAFGTETWDDGSSIESVRFVFGATNAF